MLSPLDKTETRTFSGKAETGSRAGCVSLVDRVSVAYKEPRLDADD
jgi:hypothetical protein